MTLEVIHLEFDYSDKPLLQHIDFTVNQGQALHLRGGNGVGKSTLLKLLSGILYPTQGDIRYQGHSIYQNKGPFQQNICYVGHKNAFSPWLTVLENCRFVLNRTITIQDCRKLMHTFDLSSYENVLYGQLSEGLRRRVALLRLWMTEASIWLLDEPLVALDRHSVDLFIQALTSHLSKGGLVVLSSHQPLALADEYYREYDL